MMKTKSVLLNDGDEITLYLNEKDNLWYSDPLKVIGEADCLDFLLMAENNIVIERIEFSRKELAVLQRYNNSLKSSYSKYKLRKLANEDIFRLKKLITTIIEHKG